MSRLPERTVSQQLADAERNRVEGEKEQADLVAGMRSALRAIANDPRVPADIAVLARTAANPAQG